MIALLLEPGNRLNAGGVVLSRHRFAYSRQMPRTDDSALMLAYAAGDVGAFEQLYLRHKDALYRYLLRQSGNAAIAEDVAQEVWAKVIAARDRYRPDAKFSTFLFRVARNAFIDDVRRNRLRAVSDDYDDERRPADSGAPDQEFDRNALAREFQVALTDLPDDQRDAFLLKEESGLTLEEIAKVCGVNRETIKSRLRYAGTKLKAQLASALGNHGNDGHD